MNGKVALVRQRLDLAEAVRDCVQSMRTTGRLEQHLLLQAVPAWVEADPTRIEQIVSNLISNALKYTPAGGGITIKSPTSAATQC